MAKPILTVLAFTLVVFALIQTLVLAKNDEYENAENQNQYGPGSLKPSQCPSECSRRCSKTRFHKPCMFFCQKCCSKCLCVPPGYSGNKEVCACYNDLKTKRGGPKCP